MSKTRCLQLYMERVASMQKNQVLEPAKTFFFGRALFCYFESRTATLEMFVPGWPSLIV